MRPLPSTTFRICGFLAIFGTVLAFTGPDLSSIPTPPRFENAQEHEQKVYFTVERFLSDNSKVDTKLHNHELKCVAVGIPAPTYTWRKNGKPFDYTMFSEKVAKIPGEGTLRFSNLSEEDAGKYQCLASNDNGTALSAPIVVEQTWIRHFKESDPIIITVNHGDPLAVNCSVPASSPPARVYWIRMGDGPGEFHSINSSAISSNEHYYTCAAENTELHDYKFGSKFKLDVRDNKRRELSVAPPSEQYVNQSAPIALQGHTHKLHCFFSGLPSPKPYWKHNGKEISENGDNGGFRFEAYGKTLVFNVTMDKAGQYECRFPMHNDIDRVFTVMVESEPYWPDGPPPHTNTSEGETVEFDCTTMGKPTPVVTFYKNGVELPVGPGSREGERYIVVGTRLTIMNVRKGFSGQGDNAVYQCKAENKHGYVWANFFLNLLAYKPQLLEEPAKVEAVVGQDVKLECQFFGSPNAVVTWDSPQLALVEHTPEKTTPAGKGVLQLYKVTDSAQGNYHCVGSNKYGKADAMVTLEIRKATVLVPFDAMEEVHTAGGAIRLPCEAQADDRLDVEYEWLVDGRPIDKNRIAHFTIHDDHSLELTQPNGADSAEYTCVAKTKLDRAQKTVRIKFRDVPVTLTMAGILKCDSASRTATIQFQHVEAEETGVPVQEFWVEYQIDENEGIWRTHPIAFQAKSHEKIENEQRINEHTVDIGLQPFGEYNFRVSARNAVGQSAPLRVKGKCITDSKRPDSNPSDVKVGGGTPENLVVSWVPVERENWNGAQFQYKVKFRPADSQEWKEMIVPDPYASKITIDLGEEAAEQPHKPYQVMVQAVNGIGESTVMPEIAHGHSGEGVPALTVEGFGVKDGSIGANSATFRWNPIKEDSEAVNGDFAGYKITYWSVPADEDEYDDADEEEEGGAERKRRDISLRSARSIDSNDVPSGRPTKTVIAGPSAKSLEVTDLDAGTENYAFIQAINGAHEGPKSTTISFHTKDGVPTVPRSMAAHPVNPRTDDEKGVVALTWRKPAKSNGKLDGYEVSVCRKHGHRRVDCKPVDLPADANEYRVKGLEHETDYGFVVRGKTKGGVGDRASASIRTLPEITAANVAPEVPGVIVEDIDETSMNVSMVPGKFNQDERNPIGNNFYVEYRPKGEAEWTRVDPISNDSLRVTVDGLSPGTEYEVRTLALERDGQTDPSSTSGSQTVRTKGRSMLTARMWLLLILLLILLLLLCICCIICVACRHRGNDYPVSQREREQGREPILGKPHFGEYKNDEDEKRSLTGSKAESETDSMAEYGDTDPGRFTEDGSFIGQYVPQKTLIAQEPATKGSTSTFV